MRAAQVSLCFEVRAAGNSFDARVLDGLDYDRSFNNLYSFIDK